MDNKKKFIEAINEKNLIKIKYKSKEKGIIERKCVPFDFGPSNRIKDGINRFHAYSINSPRGPHIISILPEQIIEINILYEKFEPEDYVHWTPYWHTKRNWGIYS